ncbi:CDP-alcohol phosphatidyltransferase family protein [Candidatus Aenigmatarchaeota archaeon]
MFYKDIRGYIIYPDFFSIAGLIFGIISIFSSLRGNIEIAAVCIVIAAVFDFFDGKVARYMKRKGRFGVELDNLCDVTIYLIAVSLFGYMVGLNSIIAMVVFTLFIVSGVLRLARFAIIGTTNGYYEGLPVSHAFITPIAYFVLISLNIDKIHLLWFYFIPAILMISIIKVKKP